MKETPEHGAGTMYITELWRRVWGNKPFPLHRPQSLVQFLTTLPSPQLEGKFKAKSVRDH